MTTPTVGTVENPFNIDVVSELGQQGIVIATTNPVTGGIGIIKPGSSEIASQYDLGFDESQIDSKWVPAPGLCVYAGTATAVVDNRMPAAQAADSVTTGFSTVFPGEIGVRYEVFLLWSNASAGAGNVRFRMGYKAQTIGDNMGLASPLHYATVPARGQGRMKRTQLPISAVRRSKKDQMVFNVERDGASSADTLAGAINVFGLEFVPIQNAKSLDARIVSAENLSVSVKKTPYDGVAVQRGFSLFTPIWTGQTAVYVAEPVTIGGVPQSRLAAIDKATGEVVYDVQMAARAHNEYVGHLDCSVCEDADGNVISHSSGHYIAWDGKVSADGDLSVQTPIAGPSGSSNYCSYRRFFRNPYNGEIWMGIRGDSYLGGVYKWNGTGFDRKPAASMIAGNSTAVDGIYWGTYGIEIGFGDASTIYVVTEPMRSTIAPASGYPRNNVGCIKSTDGGATWKTMRGEDIVLPAIPGHDDDIAFPTNFQGQDVVCARIAIGADKQPIIIASWRHEDDALRSLWAAKWDDTNKQWTRRRLAKNNGTYDIGNPHAIYTADGRIIVSVSDTDDHRAPSAIDGPTGPEFVPPDNRVNLLVSDDSGVTWTRYGLSAPQGGYGGAYLDPESMRIDGVLRMMPRRESTPSESEFWEVVLPD